MRIEQRLIEQDRSGLCHANRGRNRARHCRKAGDFGNRFCRLPPRAMLELHGAGARRTLGKSHHDDTIKRAVGRH